MIATIGTCYYYYQKTKDSRLKNPSSRLNKQVQPRPHKSGKQTMYLPCKRLLYPLATSVASCPTSVWKPSDTEKCGTCGTRRGTWRREHLDRWCTELGRMGAYLARCTPSRVAGRWSEHWKFMRTAIDNGSAGTDLSYPIRLAQLEGQIYRRGGDHGRSELQHVVVRQAQLQDEATEHDESGLGACHGGPSARQSDGLRTINHHKDPKSCQHIPLTELQGTRHTDIERQRSQDGSLQCHDVFR